MRERKIRRERDGDNWEGETGWIEGVSRRS